MADSKELRAIVGAMTDRPWALSSPPEFIVSVSNGGLVADCYYGARCDRENAAGVAALVNHGDAFADLVAACEWFDVYVRGGDVSIAAVARDLIAALRKVHAVGKEPSDG